MNFHGWRYKRFHISHGLGWLTVGIIVGLPLARLGTLELGTVYSLAAMLLSMSLLRRARWWSLVCVVMVGVMFGWLRGSEFMISTLPYKALVGQTAEITGVIQDDPQYGDRGDQRFRLTNIRVKGVSLPGEVYVGSYTILDVKRGDEVTLKGKIRDGFGSFQASMSFATVVQAEARHDPVREFRDWFAAGVRGAVEEPAASLGIGFVVGQRAALPETLDDQLRAVGLTHIVVASGYNLTILVRFARRMLENSSKYLAAASSAALIISFVAVSGLSPSMTRASIVTGLSLLAWYYGRRFHPLLLIVYVAALTAYIYPPYLWGDIGWYLSFLAFGGVLIVAPMMTKLCFRDRKPHALLQIVIETIAAQIMTLPLILMVFGQLPVLSLIANVLVAPLIPFAMALVAVAGVVGMFMAGIGGFVGGAAEMVLSYILLIVKWLAAPTWSQLQLAFSPMAMAICYVVIVIGAFILWRKLAYDFRSTSLTE